MKTRQELEKLSTDALTDFIQQERATVQKHRFGIGGSDAMAARTAKKNVARALTVLTARTNATTK